MVSLKISILFRKYSFYNKQTWLLLQFKQAKHAKQAKHKQLTCRSFNNQQRENPFGSAAY